MTVDKRKLKNKKVVNLNGWYLIYAGVVLFLIGFAYYFLSGVFK